MEKGKILLKNIDRFKNKEDARSYWDKNKKHKWRKRMQPFCQSIPSVAMHELEFEQWCLREFKQT